MSSYFINGIFLPNDSRWASQCNSACGRTQTTGGLRAQDCKCYADFKGNHHVCGHRRSLMSLAGRSCLATGTGFQLYSSTRAWEILWWHRAGASSPWKDIGSSEGFLWMHWTWHGCHNNPYFYPYSLGFLGLAAQTMGHWESGSTAEHQAAKATVPGFKATHFQTWWVTATVIQGRVVSALSESWRWPGP